MKFPKKSQFPKLSDCVDTKHLQNLDIASLEVDDLCAAERYDFASDLNSILLGKLPRFLLKRNEHLKVLSMETILESQCVDDIGVKKILSEVNKEWLKTKPLQLIGCHVPGKPFIDRPPKRVLKTDTSLEQCQQLFKEGVCRYLADFCHLLDSDELLNFFLDDILDNVVRKRFEHFRSQLAKNMEKWCEELKQLEFPRLGTLSKNLSQISNNNLKNKSSYTSNIEQELDEIIKSQFAELHQPAKKRKICTQESLNLDDVLNAQMLDETGEKNKSLKNKNNLQMSLEKEFDVFNEELANICNRGSQKIVDNLYSPIHHMDDGTDELFDDGIACAKSTVVPSKGSLSDNESGEAPSTTIQKSKAVSRSLRKKKLDKEDQQDNAQKRHKRKKEDKKHKLKKRKKNKHKDADKDVPSKSEERELNVQIQNDLKCDEQPVKKSFQPEPRLYEDSYLSSGFDVYQSQKGIDRLYTNFDVDFDPTLAPGSHESPLMHIFMDSSGVMEQLVGVIPDIKQFCVDLVNSKNAFLWALSLSTLDPCVQNRQDDDETPRKQALKCSNNPLMQAFRQAVEASKKKDDIKVKSCKKSKNSAQTKSLFKSFGLMGIFKMNANLKATSRELIKDAFNTFQNEVDKYSKGENFFENHMTHEIDFSGVSPHLEKVSQVMSDLYHGAEKKLSSRGKSKSMRYNPLKSVVGMHSYVSNNLKGATGQLNSSDRTNVSNSATSSFSAAQSSAYSSGAVYSASAASITASTLGYSGYAYNPYSAMHYPQVTWAYQAGYIPGYMPDLSSMQAYQGLAMQYPMMASATVVPANAEVMQTLQQPVAVTSDENSTDWNVASQTSASDEASLGKSSTAKKGSALNRPPKNTRTYIFKNETSLSKEVERYLDNIGLKKFDLYNLALLRHLPNFECLIFIHEEDSKLVNQIPGLLRLKRDLRVVFVVYNNFDDVMNKKYSMIFPRAGMVLMDESALIACKSDVLDGLCQFMRKQTYEKGTAWKLLITSSTFKILDQLMYQLEDDIEEHVRITEISQILQTSKTAGIVEVLTDEFYTSDPKSTADYQACFLALQKARHGSCRHFLFVTDMPRNHPDAKMFLSNGIDIMNVVEFMRCFVSKTVIHSPKIFESYVTRHIPEKYLDAPISDCAQTISF